MECWDADSNGNVTIWKPMKRENWIYRKEHEDEISLVESIAEYLSAESSSQTASRMW